MLVQRGVQQTPEGNSWLAKVLQCGQLFWDGLRMGDAKDHSLTADRLCMMWWAFFDTFFPDRERVFLLLTACIKLRQNPQISRLSFHTSPISKRKTMAGWKFCLNIANPA